MDSENNSYQPAIQRFASLCKKRKIGVTFRQIFTRIQQQAGRFLASSSIREVIRHIGAVCVIPVTENNEVIVERQYRYPLDRVILEIPAGKLEAPDEDRLSAIQRELREETGYSADEWTNIGDFHPAPAYSDEYITMYLARGLHKGTQDLDADEFLNVYTVPLRDLVNDVMNGKISDAKTQVAILKAARILEI